MLVHSVFFWLREDLTAAQRSQFRHGLDSLARISAVKEIYIGTPAATEKRAVIDDSYSFALTVIVEDLAAQQAYQVDPIHLAFVAACKPYWTRVQIYDAV
jgi:hypothetical protein